MTEFASVKPTRTFGAQVGWNRRTQEPECLCTRGFHILAWIACTFQLLTASPRATANDSGPIRIGVSCVRSGPSAELGNRLIDGSQRWFDRINNEGGIHGRRIEMVIKDDGYEPDPAVQNTYELVTQEKVFFLFNYVGTPTLTRVLPLLKYFESEHMVNVAPFTGADPQRIPPYNRFVFNIRASYEDETRALVEYFVRKGYQRIGFFGQADAYGKSGEIGVTRALAAHGLKPTAVVTYRRNLDPDAPHHEQLEILRKAGTDAVIAVGVYGPCAAFVRDARLTGWNVPIANVSFVGAHSLLQRLREHSKKHGKDLATHLVNSQVVPCSFDDVQLPLVQSFRKVFGSQNDAMFVEFEGWLNAAVVTEALRRSGPNPTRLNFIRSMESLSHWDPGIGVPLAFSPTNHLALSHVWLTKTDQGRWVTENLPPPSP